MTQVAVIGAGPAGLMAAEALAEAAARAPRVEDAPARAPLIEVFDAMPSVGRKFLLAGKGGLNLTHSEPLHVFLDRYGPRRDHLDAAIRAFDPEAIRRWARGLGVETFVGSSGRVFPAQMRAAPLLRAWVHRLRSAGVRFQMRHRWVGWRAGDDGFDLVFDTPMGQRIARADAVIFALGGASWPRLGSDGAWAPGLRDLGIEVADWRPANCGFDVDWTAPLRGRFAGHPLKSVVVRYVDAPGAAHERRGECVVSDYGLEGSLVYACAADWRDLIERDGHADIMFDLLPDLPVARVRARLDRPRGARSLANHLRQRVGIEGVKAALLREGADPASLVDPARCAARLKALPVRLRAPRPVAEAISSAGGVRFESLDANLMLVRAPGAFCVGEMLDWEAPTGGYLLSACLATGRAAAHGLLAWLDDRRQAGGPTTTASRRNSGAA